MSYQYSDNYTQQQKSHHEGHESHEPSEPSVHDHKKSEVMVEAVSDSKEYKKFAAVVGVIVLCATTMSIVLGFDWQEWMRWFMSGTFVIFGSFKLIGYEMYIVMFPTYDILAKRSKLYNYFYPFIELMLGFLYAADLFSLPRDVITLVIMSIGTYGVLKVLPRSEAVRCACLGNIIKLPLSTVTLFEDVAMAAMAAIMFISHFIS